MTSDPKRNRVATSYGSLPGSTAVTARLSRDHEPIRHGVLKLQVKWTDFQPLATPGPQTITLFLPEAGEDLIIRDVWADLVATFEDGAISTADLEIGRQGDPNAFLLVTAVGLGTPLGSIGTANGEKGVELATHSTPIITAGDAVTITLTVTGGNIDDLTQGEATIWVEFVEFAA